MTTPLELSMKMHPELSFSDGNVILHADGRQLPDNQPGTPTNSTAPSGKQDSESTSYTCFRVHMAILSGYSEVFAAAFRNPQKSKKTSYAGCVELGLKDDPEDVEKLLKIVYARAPRYERMSKASFDFYAPALRLAKKYEMSRFIDTYLPCVLEGWPTTLEDWDDEQELHKTLQRMRKGRSQYSVAQLADEGVVHPASLLEFSRDFPTTFQPVLPTLYYQLSRLPPRQRRIPLPGSKSTASEIGNSKSLSLSDHEILASGIDAMMNWFVKYANHPSSVEKAEHLESDLDDLEVDPCSEGSCSGRFDFWHRAMSHLIFRSLSKQDPPGILDISAVIKKDIQAIKPNTKKSAAYVCSGCHRRLIHDLEDFREETWRKLAEFFSEEDAGN